jgi:hypothetical protein
MALLVAGRVGVEEINLLPANDKTISTHTGSLKIVYNAKI